MRINRSTKSPMSLPTIGEIKTGGKAQGKSGEYPVSYDYFVASCKSKEHKALFDNYYKEKPTSIRIFFLEEIEKSVDHRFTLARSNQSKHEIFAKGDGMTFDVWVGNKYITKKRPDDKPMQYPPEDDEWMSEIVAHLNKTNNAQMEWKEQLTLYFYVEGVKVKGFWRYITHAKKSTIPQILDELEDIQKRFGTITKFPYDLTVVKVKSNKPGVANSFPVVSINANISAEAIDRLQRFIGGGGDLNKLGTGMIIQESDVKQLGDGNA